MVTSRHVKIGITCAIGLGAAALSYDHALTVARDTGTVGRMAYVVPLLGDGLIALASAELYDAAKEKDGHPAAAVTGLVLGIAVTVAMNVASGWHHGWGGRLVNSLAPVALLIAVWVLERGLRRGRDDQAGEAAELPVATCAHLVPATATRGEKVLAAWAHMAECEGVKPSFRGVGKQLGIHHRLVGEHVKASMAAAGTAALNGDGPHE